MRRMPLVFSLNKADASLPLTFYEADASQSFSLNEADASLPYTLIEADASCLYLLFLMRRMPPYLFLN